MLLSLPFSCVNRTIFILQGYLEDAPPQIACESDWEPHLRETTTQDMRRRRMPALCSLAAAVLWLRTVHAASASCANASTVVQDSDTVAIAFDASCTARTFTVLQQSATQRSLNLSNLDIASVESYPRVYEMDLSHNELTTFSIASDNDMETLYVTPELSNTATVKS